MIPENIKTRLRQTENVIIFSGAGMSQESGISTFRDATGLWAKFDPYKYASPQGFKANPQKVWDWYCLRAAQIRNCQPNDGHYAIAELEKHLSSVTVVSQNVDDLHERALSKSVIHLHGSIFQVVPFVDEAESFGDGRNPVVCHCCGNYADPDTLDPYASREDIEGLALVTGAVPHCPACGSLFRPGVVWFSESLHPQTLDAAFNAVDTCDALICVGSSLEVSPANEFPFRAKKRGAVVIEVNPLPTALSPVADLYLQGTAAKVLPELIRQVWG